MNSKDVEIFEKLKIQITGLYDEVSLLSKKSPDKPISKFKLKYVNQILQTSNKILTDKYAPFDDFAVFDSDDMPTNSDVIMIISQYVKCLEKLRIDNIKKDGINWYWIIDGKKSSVKTSHPIELR